ncbi:hypothetical protein FHY12_004087 [Xanthomonas arboricola]|nr:hypothetical protein [Xanthomonas euroxanthea]
MTTSLQAKCWGTTADDLGGEQHHGAANIAAGPRRRPLYHCSGRVPCTRPPAAQGIRQRWMKASAVL